ncbi:MAG TPA: DUF3488 and transglutaminase-like domain-containing protein [Actinomycetes bacterium]|nr:DUF3488 and transglutaminase-like domain-containing protein [Actinomycetes bacterium]
MASPPSRSELALGLAVAGLLAGASLSLARLYEDGRWLLPTWLTIASALGLAAVLRRFGLGSLLSLLVLLAGFVVVAGNLLFQDTVALVVPTPATLAAMRDAVHAAFQGVAEEAAPVAATREFLLLTCAGAWAVTLAADGLAFRAGQPLLAIVPALGQFIFPAMIRPASPGWYTLWFLLGTAGLLLHEGRARLAAWGQWVASPRVRPGSRWRVPISPANATGRRLAIGVGALALAVPWLLPGYGQEPLLDYRAERGPATTASINPFVSLKPNLLSRGNAALFTISAQEATYWRLLTLDRFNGVTFDTPAMRPTGQFVGDVSGDLEPGAPARRLEQQITVEGWRGVWLPAAAAPLEVRVRRTVLTNVVHRGITIQGRWRRGFSYQVVSLIPDPDARLLRQPQHADRPELSRYLELPRNLDSRVSQIAQDVAGTRPTAYDQALALQDWFRSGSNFTYDLDVPELLKGTDQLVRFLSTTRRGYCEQFAASMAVLARVLGIPSRVAVGFTPGELTGDGYRITAQDLHAWPELWFTGVGWIRFEPTPRPDQISDPFWTSPVGRTAAPPTTLPGVSPTPSASPGAGANPRLPDEATGGQAGGDSGGGLLRNPFVQVALVLLLLVALLPAAKAARRGAARARAREPAAAVRDAWAGLTDLALDVRAGRRPAESPGRFARRLGARFPDAAEPLERLTRVFERAVYGSRPPSAEQAGQARALAATARGRILRALGWRDRLRAGLSLRSLLHALPGPRSVWPAGAQRGRAGG